MDDDNKIFLCNPRSDAAWIDRIARDILEGWIEMPPPRLRLATVQGHPVVPDTSPERRRMDALHRRIVELEDERDALEPDARPRDTFDLLRHRLAGWTPSDWRALIDLITKDKLS